MIPAVEGLLDEPYNGQLLTLLYRLAEWHALAKLRMHTEHTLEYLDKATTKLGHELRSFRDWTQKAYSCQELPRETDARNRRRQRRAKEDHGRTGGGTTEGGKVKAKPNASTSTNKNENANAKAKEKAKPRSKTLNLSIYKFHALGDYAQTIRLFGTTDSYSTQTVAQLLNFKLLCSILFMQGELAHCFVKRLYGRTNKKNAVKQIAKNERRNARLSHAHEAAAAPHQSHHVQFSDHDPLPPTSFHQHHHMSDSKNFPHHLMSFISQPPNDPAKKMSFC